VYLKDHSPYPDSSLFVVNLRIQLELIYWATTPPVIIILLICSYLHTQPNNRTHRSSCYKVPLQLGFLIKIIAIAIGEELTLINPLLRYFYST